MLNKYKKHRIDRVLSSLKGEWHINISRKGNCVYVQPEGSISFLTVDDIKKDVYDFIDKKDILLTLNLAKVDFMDSAGLGLLISFLKHMKGNGGKLAVEYPQLGVQRLLEMTRMEELFEVKKKPEEKTGSWSEFM